MEPKYFNELIKPASEKFIKQYKCTFKKEFEPEIKVEGKQSDDPLSKNHPKEIYNLFKIMRNLINGTLISAKFDIKTSQNKLTLEDFTVYALRYLIEQNTFSAPALKMGIS